MEYLLKLQQRPRSECEMAAAPTGSDKPPFDNLIARVPIGLLKQALGLEQEGQKVVLNPTFIWLLSVLSRALYYGLEKLGASIGLESQQVSDVISAADGDREEQIHYLLLAWVERRGEEATVEALLRGLYDADDTKAIEEVVERMSTPGQGMCCEHVSAYQWLFRGGSVPCLLVNMLNMFPSYSKYFPLCLYRFSKSYTNVYEAEVTF